jgi:phosphoribosylaminoimidazole-succinocarboxamide synthase/formyltetrahydrofolate-dependent phosphoribosylglycinamide formyltransferase
MPFNIIVFVSGNGTNLQELIDASSPNAEGDIILPINIVKVICNKKDAYAIERCAKANVPYSVIIKKKEMTKQEYEDIILKEILQDPCDMIVLAGWMYVLSEYFLNQCNKSHKCDIINLHPALPGKFPGANAIGEAFVSFQFDKIDKTGVMVHRVIPEIDAGEVIDCVDVPIYNNDTLSSLEQRVSYFEKPLLLHAISKLLHLAEKEKNLSGQPRLLYDGKVRNVYDIGYGLIALESTDRQSAFDKHICTIPGKGTILTEVSSEWFKLTKDIMPNHFLFHDNNVMICRKAERYDVEVVVRGYITGSTSTSLWTHYAKGVRNYCGIQMPDGLIKNQKLQYPIVTPTTKDANDKPLTPDEIIERRLMTNEEWTYVREKALQLYLFGVEYAKKKGLILVDTKYEFGKDPNGNIILIDELHTCDSSRFWIESTYNDKFLKGENPDSLDKDVVRNYIVSKCDPYKDEIPIVPSDIINRVTQAYNDFRTILMGNNAENNLPRQQHLPQYYLPHRPHQNDLLQQPRPYQNDLLQPRKVETVVANYFTNEHNAKIAIVKTSKTQMSHLIPCRELFEKNGIYTRVFNFEDIDYYVLESFQLVITENLEQKILISRNVSGIVITKNESNDMINFVQNLISM